MTFVPPAIPTHETSQMDTVAFISTRMSARRSNDPDLVAWYLDLSGNILAQEQFEIARKRINALMSSGWRNHGNYNHLRDMLALHPDLGERFEDDPSRFTSIAFLVDREKRYFLLEAPVL